MEENAKGVQNNPDYYRKQQQITEHMFGTLKRQRGFTFTLMRGKEKVLGEVGLMFIGYNLSRCISVLGAKKPIRALREYCLQGVLEGFGLVLSYFKRLSKKYKSFHKSMYEKYYGLYGYLLKPCALSLIVN